MTHDGMTRHFQKFSKRGKMERQNGRFFIFLRFYKSFQFTRHTLHAVMFIVKSNK